MKIYKEDVLEALETEPLGWSGWYFPATVTKDTTCTVCAVGAVLRHAGVSPNSITPIAINITKGAIAPSEWGSGRLPTNWMAALSYLWESLRADPYKQTPIEEARDIMIEWVEANVPEDIDLIEEVG